MDINQTLKEREKTHGNFVSHATISQKLKEVCYSYNDSNLDYDQREAVDMICHKIARILNGNPNIHDHWHDIAGYATLIANRLADVQK